MLIMSYDILIVNFLKPRCNDITSSQGFPKEKGFGNLFSSFGRRFMLKLRNRMSHGNLCLFCVVYIIFFSKMLLFSFLKSNFKMAFIWKGCYFWPLFSHFVVTREKTQNFLQHIAYLHKIHVSNSPFWLFCLKTHPFAFAEKENEFIVCGFSLEQNLVLILIRRHSRHFIKMVSNKFNGWQLAKMKKSIPDKSLP